MIAPLVRIVLVHFGPLGPTLDLLSRIADWGPVTVVANDGTRPPQGLPQSVDWLVAPRNLGYGGAFNFVAAEQEADVYALFNTDISIEWHVFDAAIASMWGDATIGVLAPVVEFQDGVPQSGAGRIEGITRRPRPHFYPDADLVECQWVTGAAMFLSRQVARETRFDSTYFLGCEDVDLCVRTTRDGLRVVCLTGARVLHTRGHVIGAMWAYYTVRNRVWLSRRLWGRMAGVTTWVFFLLLWPRILLADVLKRHSLTSSRLHLRGLLDALRHQPRDRPWPDEPRPWRWMR